MRRLILFDIDGTLLSARGAPRRAFERALIEVYGTAGPIATHSFNGKTDPQITRELLHAAGLDDAVIDRGMSRLWSVYLAGLEAELSKPDHRTHVYPGVRSLLERLQAMTADVVVALLTGNIEPGAALKLRSAALTEPFRFGAYGSDCEQRSGLPPVAVERALAATGKRFEGTDIVVIGDTPHDVTCGQALGVRAIAVATGPHDRMELADAGAAEVFEDLADTGRVLQAIMA